MSEPACTVLDRPPPIIALCGHPRHGKSTVQAFLHSELGVEVMDDGHPIRLEAMKRFDLTWEQVSTQAGKAGTCFAFGREMEVREALGLIGKEWEEEDSLIVPKKALQSLRENGTGNPVSFGSIRRNQGRMFKRVGALVVEICDPDKPLSPHDFDQYESEWIDVTIINDGSMLDLERKAVSVARRYLAAYNGDYQWD